MQVEAYREAVAALGRQALAMRRHENVLAVEPPAVGGKPQRALMHDAEAIRIAVVRRAQDQAVRGPGARPARRTAGHDRRTEQRFSDSAVRKRHDEVSLKVTVECAAVARATWRQVSRLVAGSPQLTTMR